MTVDIIVLLMVAFMANDSTFSENKLPNIMIKIPIQQLALENKRLWYDISSYWRLLH